MRIWPLLLLSAVAFTSGCDLQPTATSVTNAAPGSVHGTVIGGQNPVNGATISVYEVGTSGYGTGAVLKASTTSDAGGNFAFNTTVANTYTCSFANAPMYIVATAGDSGSGANANTALIAGLGPCSVAQNQHVILNEVTTAATVWALGQFFSTTLGPGVTPNIGGPAAGSGTYNKGLVAAMNNTLPKLVDINSGIATGNTTSGSVTLTTESAKINSIANVLAACVNSQGQTNSTETTTLCGQLFNGSNAKSAITRPYNTIQAALMMDLYPYYNVTNLYNLSSTTPPFLGLSATPNDWTVGLSYTTSAFGLGVKNNPEMSNIDIDASGRIWFPSNLPTATGLVYFDPSTTTFNGPYGGPSLIWPQYLAIDLSATPYVWATDINSGNVVGVSTASPSTTITLNSGSPQGGAIEVNPNNTITFVVPAGAPNGAPLVIPVDRSTATRSGTFLYNTLPTGIINNDAATNLFTAVDGGNGNCFVQVGDGSTIHNFATTSEVTCVSGGISQITGKNLSIPGTPDPDFLAAATDLNELCTSQGCINYGLALSGPTGIAPDGTSHMWIANKDVPSLNVMGVTMPVGPTYFTYGNTVTSIAYKHGPGFGGTMTSPFGVAVDGSGNIWVSNAGCIGTSYGLTCTQSAFVLSEIVGAAGPTLTPLAAVMNSFSVTPKPTQ